MWAEFEWENKVAINTSCTELREFLDHIISQTNMTCLTPLDDALGGGVLGAYSNFLAANLHARSVFGKYTTFELLRVLTNEFGDCRRRCACQCVGREEGRC